jgi:hypothetical protein
MSILKWQTGNVYWSGSSRHRILLGFFRFPKFGKEKIQKFWLKIFKMWFVFFKFQQITMHTMHVCVVMKKGPQTYIHTLPTLGGSQTHDLPVQRQLWWPLHTVASGRFLTSFHPSYKILYPGAKVYTKVQKFIPRYKTSIPGKLVINRLQVEKNFLKSDFTGCSRTGRSRRTRSQRCWTGVDRRKTHSRNNPGKIGGLLFSISRGQNLTLISHIPP